MKLIEAISDWEDQIGMQDTYGCFVLFDNKLSAIIHKIGDTELKDYIKNICYFANGKKFSGKNYDERKANASRNLAEFEPFLNKSAEERPNGEPNSDIGTVNEADEEAINELLRLAGC